MVMVALAAASATGSSSASVSDSVTTTLFELPRDCSPVKTRTTTALLAIVSVTAEPAEV